MDGTLTGTAAELPPGDHDAEIVLLDHAKGPCRDDVPELLARVRRIQAEVAALPLLDRRTPEEILRYNERGHFE